ncbi:MAG: sialidase family protein [Pirellulales bacterium]|nr:sialidase family protein [Thermoguttaceae bacterium]MDD4787180.1 sialidase family protein [Pirellulales bacterium]
MPDRRLTGCLLLTAWSVACAALAGDAGGDAGRAPRALANDYTVVYESPDAATIYAYSPGLIELPGGRLIATMDQGGPGVGKLPNANRGGMVWRGRVYASDDGGRTWQLKTDSPMIHARPLLAGGRLYVLGHQGFLVIMRSDDGGDSFGAPARLTESSGWHQAPCNVCYARGKVYLVMERNTDPAAPGWPVAVLAPVVMSAPVGADLTDPNSWTFSNEYCFRDAVAEFGKPNLIGAPFYKTGLLAPESRADKRGMSDIGWLETNVVQFADPNHLWYDPAGRTFHLWMRAHTGTTNLACIAKAIEGEDGSLSVGLERAPSGEPMLFVPCPGGQMKFHILFDEQTRLFWLLSSQATDSMTDPKKLPDDRYNLPNNERHRLALHFSTNCVDWCFAGIVSDSGHAGQGRHYASMAFSGEDLLVLSRSGDGRAKDAHNGNLITFHRVRQFRQLVY